MRIELSMMALLLLWVMPARAGEEAETPPAEPVGAYITKQADLTIYEAIVAGRILDWTILPQPAPPDVIALLIEPESESDKDDEQPREVVLWSLAGDGRLEGEGPELTEEATSVAAFDLTGDGLLEILVMAGTELLAMGEDGFWTPVLESAYDVFPVEQTDGSRIRPDNGPLFLRSVGLLQAVTLDPSGRLQTVWEQVLPIRVNRRGGGLRLATPPVAYWSADESASMRLVVGPETLGTRRLRSLLLPVTSDGPPEPLEAWSMFSNLEEVEESWFVTFEGAPALLVTTVLADKHGVFEKKKLRLFALSADRTRSGTTPLLETMTKSRNWYGTCAGIADVNGDGLDDVVSAQPKGLGGGKLWVEAHLARQARGFDPKIRGSEIPVDEGEHCTLGVDVSGDGRIDLIIVEGNDLLVFPLIQGTKDKTVVADSPLWRARFHDIDSRPQAARLFHSQVAQVVVLGQTEGGRQAIRVVRLHEE